MTDRLEIVRGTNKKPWRAQVLPATVADEFTAVVGIATAVAGFEPLLVDLDTDDDIVVVRECCSARRSTSSGYIRHAPALCGSPTMLPTVVGV